MAIGNAANDEQPSQAVDRSIIDDIDNQAGLGSENASSAPLTPRRGRKRAFIDLTEEGGSNSSTPTSKAKKRRRSPKSPLEKRQRRFRSHAPESFSTVLERALTQRMFVLDRASIQVSIPSPPTPASKIESASNLIDDPPSPTYAPSEIVTIAGTTGNVYEVTITHVPRCTCPHAMKGNQCKHIIYVLNRVLKAPAHLQYQLAFLTSELEEIFAKAPPINPEVETNHGEGGEDGDGFEEGRKKIEEGDDCPICCVEFSETNDALVWCKAACGNNMHKACFGRWVAQKKGMGGDVTCPFCRTPWAPDDPNTTQETDPSNIRLALADFSAAGSSHTSADGYVNIGDRLGLSGVRGGCSQLSKQMRLLMEPFTFFCEYEFLPPAVGEEADGKTEGQVAMKNDDDLASSETVASERSSNTSVETGSDEDMGEEEDESDSESANDSERECEEVFWPWDD